MGSESAVGWEEERVGDVCSSCHTCLTFCVRMKRKGHDFASGNLWVHICGFGNSEKPFVEMVLRIVGVGSFSVGMGGVGFSTFITLQSLISVSITLEMREAIFLVCPQRNGCMLRNV